MAYTQILFEVTDAFEKDICSFKINMVAREIAIEYRNMYGGRTTNSFSMSDSQYNHIKMISSEKVFERFRDGKWKKETEWAMDSHNWKAIFISDSGKPILVIESDKSITYIPPSALITLVEYVVQISSFDNFSYHLS